jgi:uncharacterized membrane-anchored protein
MTNTTWTASGDKEKKSDIDTTWTRFWLGIAAVALFAIGSILLVVGVAGVHAGADYGLVILIMALLTSVVDGVVIAARRRGR